MQGDTVNNRPVDFFIVMHGNIPNRLRKNYCDTQEIGWFPRITQQENTPAGCSKRLSSKAAASEGPRRTLWGSVEGLNDVRTLLADFFSILLKPTAFLSC